MLLIAGIAATAGAILLSIKATLKLEDTLGKANQEIKQVKNKMKDENKLASGEYTLQSCKRELTKVYAKNVCNVLRLYIPTTMAFGVSISCLFGAHKIMKGRNIALAAAYTAMDNGWKNYRERVINKVGKETEREIFKNIYEEEREVTVIDKEGNEKTVTKKIKVPHMDKDNIYSYLFDSSNPDWSNSGRLNIDYLLGKEKYLNQRFIAQGYLFLHDIYAALGIEPGMIDERKLQASRVIGWIYDPVEDTGDNYISFGLSDKEGNLTKEAMDMLRYGERDVWLEFNPDGDILTGKNNGKTFMKYAKYLY